MLSSLLPTHVRAHHVHMYDTMCVCMYTYNNVSEVCSLQQNLAANDSDGHQEQSPTTAAFTSQTLDPYHSGCASLICMTEHFWALFSQSSSAHYGPVLLQCFLLCLGPHVGTRGMRVRYSRCLKSTCHAHSLESMNLIFRIHLICSHICDSCWFSANQLPKLLSSLLLEQQLMMLTSCLTCSVSNY
jgi:hypothetical protein